MTAICPGGGPSQAIPGFGTVVYSSAAALATFLATKVAPLWATGLSAGLTASAIELNTLCLTDPPADPGIIGTDVAAIFLRGNPAATVAAQIKLDTLLKRYLWYSYCQCAPGPTPAVPAPLPPPSGLPSINPPSVFPVPVAGTPCDSLALHTASSAGPSTGVGSIKGIAYTRLFVQSTTVTLTGATWALTLGNWYDDPAIAGPQAALTNKTYSIPTNTSFYDILPGAPGTTFVRPDFSISSGVGTSLVQYTLDAYCSLAGPGAPSVPCCPPDTALQAEIDQILQTVTLIQRQIAPFAYVPGNVHAGLTGHGTIAISGLVGLKINVTAFPSSSNFRGNDPSQYFELGFVTLGTPDGYDQSTRINRLQQILLPPRCSAYTDFGYQLGAGVTATVTELLREP